MKIVRHHRPAVQPPPIYQVEISEDEYTALLSAANAVCRGLALSKATHEQMKQFLRRFLEAPLMSKETYSE